MPGLLVMFRLEDKESKAKLELRQQVDAKLMRRGIVPWFWKLAGTCL